MTSIGAYGFGDCVSLENMSIPEGLTYLGTYAFDHCACLSEINIPAGLTSISNMAFFMCDGVKELRIPKNVTNIGHSAFSYCRSLEYVEIEDGITLIDSRVFYGCNKLEIISIPSSISTVIEAAFDGCNALKEVYYNGTEEEWNEVNIEEENDPLLNAQIHFHEHNWSAWKITTAPTLNSAGEKERTCSTCSKKETRIIPKLIDLINAVVSVISSKTYSGNAITPAPTVTIDNVTLKKNTDYTVSYKNNTNMGTATLTITGKGAYAGTRTTTFKITPAAQPIAVNASAESVTTGKTVTVSCTGMKENASCTYKSSDTTIATVNKTTGKVTAKNVGTVKITATAAATDNYKATSKTVTIKIVPAATAKIVTSNLATGIKLTWKKVDGATGYKVYRGSTLLTTISSGSTVTYTDTGANTNGTKYTFKVYATASTGTSPVKSVVAYRIGRPVISSASNTASGKITVKWGKNAKATGYYIQYSLDKTFESDAKLVNITNVSTVSKVISGLTKGKTYYVRVRTYKTVDGTKIWSAWSLTKTIKISK